MKKIFLKITSLLLVLLIFAGTSVSAQDIRIVVGGQQVEFDVLPIIVNDRTMVPFRAIFEAINAKVDYNADTNVVTATKRGQTIKLTIGSDVMYVDGKEVQLDSPAFIKSDRTYIPVRACAEAFGLDVEWIDQIKTVKVKTQVSVPIDFSNDEGWYTKYTYDDFGNLVYCESSDGSWEKYSYDEYGNIVSFENSIGYWFKRTYNDNGILVSEEGGGDDWTDETYDEKGNIIYSTDGYNYTKYEYNEVNQVTYVESMDYGDFYSAKYTYENGKCVYVEYNDGWEKITYDNKGNHMITECSDGTWTKSTYDERNNLIYSEHSNGGYIKNVYDEYDNLLSTESPLASGGISKTEYKYDPDGNLIESITNSNSITKYKVIIK